MRTSMAEKPRLLKKAAISSTYACIYKYVYTHIYICMYTLVYIDIYKVAGEGNLDAVESIGAQEGSRSRKRQAVEKPRLLEKVARLLEKATSMMIKASEPKKARAQESA